MDPNNPLIKIGDNESNGISVVLSNGNLVYMTEGNLKKAKKIESLRVYIILQSTLSFFLTVFEVNVITIVLSTLSYLSTIVGIKTFNIEILKINTGIMYVTQLMYILTYMNDDIIHQIIKIIIFTNNLFVILMNHLIIDYNYI